MFRLEYKAEGAWVSCGEFREERIAWVSLGQDNLDYRTVEISTGKVVTDKSIRVPNEPGVGTRWKRTEPFDPSKGDYNGYTIVGITNLAHRHINHPPQVIYRGDNGLLWSLELDKWPGSLTEEVM